MCFPIQLDLFLQWVHQAVEAIPLLCHVLAGKFAWLCRNGQQNGTGWGTWAAVAWDVVQAASWDSALVLVRLDSPASRRGSWVFAGSVLAALLKIAQLCWW